MRSLIDLLKNLPMLKIMSQTPTAAERACSYSYFDPDTFEPLNEDTRMRLLEVDFRKADFEGKTVLDIGCNTGLLSFEALAKGAKSVSAIDVQPVLVEYVQELLAQKDLPMTVVLKPFHKLDEEQDQADIVLFFEVIHWLVSQGRSIREVIAKLAGLTRQKLFIEFPWSVREPSIEAQTSLGYDDYDASLILDELNKHFETVKIERFMHYFGYESRSVRVLVTAEGRKITGRLLPYLPDLIGFERSFPWGRGRSRYVLGQKGEYLVKRIAPESRLRLLDPDLLTALFDGLSDSDTQVLSLPVKLGQGYAVDAFGDDVMAFEWLGEPMQTVAPHWKISVTDHVRLACQVTRQMCCLKPDLLDALRSSNFFAALSPSILMKRFTDTTPYHNLAPEVIQPWAKVVEGLEPSDYSHLFHGDLNTSNIINLADGDLRAVDFDNFSLGSPVLDVLFVVAIRGCSFEEMKHFLIVAKKEVGAFWPTLTAQHLIFPLYVVLGWLHVMFLKYGENPNDKTRSHIERVVRGYQSLLQLGQSLLPPEDEQTTEDDIGI